MTEGWVIEADYMLSKAVDQVLDYLELVAESAGAG